MVETTVEAPFQDGGASSSAYPKPPAAQPPRRHPPGGPPKRQRSPRSAAAQKKKNKKRGGRLSFWYKARAKAHADGPEAEELFNTFFPTPKIDFPEWESDDTEEEANT